jgi:hypothetical protein
MKNKILSIGSIVLGIIFFSAILGAGCSQTSLEKNSNAYPDLTTSSLPLKGPSISPVTSTLMDEHIVSSTSSSDHSIPIIHTDAM